MSFLDALGTALNIAAISSNASSKRKQRQDEMRALRFSALAARRRAEVAQTGYGLREEQLRRESRLALGKQRAAMAQSGVGLDGSNADVERQSQIFAELDALNIRYQGQLESSALLEQADEYEAGIGGVRSAARSERNAALLNIAGTTLAGVNRRPYDFNNTSTTPTIR